MFLDEDTASLELLEEANDRTRWSEKAVGTLIQSQPNGRCDHRKPVSRRINAERLDLTVLGEKFENGASSPVFGSSTSQDPVEVQENPNVRDSPHTRVWYDALWEKKHLESSIHCARYRDATSIEKNAKPPIEKSRAKEKGKRRRNSMRSEERAVVLPTDPSMSQVCEPMTGEDIPAPEATTTETRPHYSKHVTGTTEPEQCLTLNPPEIEELVRRKGPMNRPGVGDTPPPALSIGNKGTLSST